MTKWLLSLLLSLGSVTGPFPSSGQTQKSLQESTDIKFEIGPLRNRRFCEGDSQVYTQVFSVGERYTNRGTIGAKLVLRLEDPIALFIAKSVSDLKARRFQAEWHPTSYPLDDGHAGVGHGAEAEKAAYLAPGASVAFATSVSLIVSSGQDRLTNTIVAGGYFMQLETTIEASNVISRPETSGEQRFSKSKRLTLLSNPIPVEVPGNPKLEECSQK